MTNDDVEFTVEFSKGTAEHREKVCRLITQIVPMFEELKDTVSWITGMADEIERSLVQQGGSTTDRRENGKRVRAKMLGRAALILSKLDQINGSPIVAKEDN